MYEVWIFDADLMEFIPLRVNNRIVSMHEWTDAMTLAQTLTVKNPGNTYKVEYRGSPRKRVRRR